MNQLELQEGFIGTVQGHSPGGPCLIGMAVFHLKFTSVSGVLYLRIFVSLIYYWRS